LHGMVPSRDRPEHARIARPPPEFLRHRRTPSTASWSRRLRECECSRHRQERNDRWIRGGLVPDVSHEPPLAPPLCPPYAAVQPARLTPEQRQRSAAGKAGPLKRFVRWRCDTTRLRRSSAQECVEAMSRRDALTRLAPAVSARRGVRDRSQPQPRGLRGPPAPPPQSRPSMALLGHFCHSRVGSSPISSSGVQRTGGS
jgi:hypothetical protein